MDFYAVWASYQPKLSLSQQWKGSIAQNKKQEVPAKIWEAKQHVISFSMSKINIWNHVNQIQGNNLLIIPMEV